MPARHMRKQWKQFRILAGTIKKMLASLNEIYASGGELPLITLTIENEEIGALRFVLSPDNKELDGEIYHASAFTVQMPERSGNGFSDLSFAICGVNGECYQYINRALESMKPTLLTMKQWHPETLEQLEELTLTVTGGQLNRDTAQFTASFCDMLNLEFPRLKYTAYNSPGLKYIK